MGIWGRSLTTFPLMEACHNAGVEEKESQNVCTLHNSETSKLSVLALHEKKDKNENL
jgi:hypothetical protein